VVLRVRTATTSRAWRRSATICGGSMPACSAAASTAWIPVVVPMRWTADTPMIMMTDTSLPGLGTFTVRLFFYGDRYAGTWQHGAAGGQTSGRIRKAAARGSKVNEPVGDGGWMS
jgi:hypothetical protein